MLKRLRTAHPLVFCVLAEVVFLASLFVTDLIFTIVLVLFRADFSALDTYLYSTLQELVGALVAVLFLVRTDRAGLLRRRGSGFFNGLLVGMYPATTPLVRCCWAGRRMARCSPLCASAPFWPTWPWWVWRKSSSSGASSPRPCWNTSAPAVPVCGRPVCCPACCLVRRT